ncbi:MAG: glutathione S-transferase N-terminal domain-containing protein [Calditrichaceae bacterium]|nr:glutathione S-transferase N-terminal domain-containing protein [Calditrichaceae bacterium]MBN2707736.1 glutathione S-transferase N-terminal domain-containing protein [Calditrichaceae bacterium]RQV96449.1 MAG: NrdH-redoxin [Calditrichota bacterium]
MDRLKEPKIIVFSTPACTYCNHVKRYFREKQIRFKDIDVSKDHKAAQDMQRRTGQSGVPVILINNRPVIGFDKNKINQLLGIK